MAVVWNCHASGIRVCLCMYMHSVNLYWSWCEFVWGKAPVITVSDRHGSVVTGCIGVCGGVTGSHF